MVQVGQDIFTRVSWGSVHPFLLELGCLTGKQVGVNGFRLEVVLDNGPNGIRIKGLARKNVQIDIVRLLHEMGADVTGLDKLDEGVPLLVARAEHHDLGLAVGNHINIPNQLLGEPLDGLRTPNGLRRTLANVQCQMISPHLYVLHSSVKTATTRRPLSLF